jgi:NADPH:quinone reductase-like Zn-dependent oxidoreductase/acyl carrier protein/NADP-dependent 3-hydroxy acid dehydrogenase YdfG
MATMLAAGITTFVEIGPDAILRNYLSQCVIAAGVEALTVSLMHRTDGGTTQIDAVVDRLLLAGAPIERSALFVHPGRLVDLPAYPWQRERHWLPVTSESLGLLERRRVHPLLGYAVAGPALAWESHLDTALLPTYADHVVGGVAVLPAAGFVEMMLAASRQWQPGVQMSLEDLEIHAPLLLRAEHSRTVHLQIDPSDGRCQVRSRERASRDPWQAHAGARLVAVPHLRVAPPEDLVVPVAKAVRVDAVAHYARAAALGLQYGPAFQSVMDVELGRDGSFPALHARLQTPPAIEDDLADGILLHPSYLDGAFQLLVDLVDSAASAEAALAGTAQPLAYLPVRIDRLQLLQPQQRAAGARATVRRRGPRSLVADFMLLDAAGRVVALAQGVRFRAVVLDRERAQAPQALVMRAIPMPRREGRRGAELPALAELAARCRRRLHAPARAAERRRYADEVEPLLDVLCAAFAERAVRAVVDAAPGAEAAAIDPAELLARGEVAADAESLLRYLLQLLAEQGLVTSSGTRWRWVEQPPTLPAAEDVWASLIADYPEHGDFIGRVGSAGLRLAARLRGGSHAQSARPRCDVAWFETCTRAQARELLDAVSELLQHAVASQGAGGRLRVLCLCTVAPLEELDFPVGIDADRCELVIGAPTAELADAWQVFLRERPYRQVRVLDTETGCWADAPAGTESGPAGFDVVVLADGLAQAPEPRRLLQLARTSLVEGGLLVVLEQAPARPIDFAFGSDPRWWSAAGQGASSRLRGPAAWCELLAQAGFAEAQTVSEIAPGDDPAQAPSGAVLLLALAAPAPGRQTPISPSSARGAWIVLQDPSGYSAELGEEIENELSTQGQQVLTVVAGARYAVAGPRRYVLDPTQTAQWCELLQGLQAAGCAISGWIHLQGLDSTSALRPLPEQVALQQRRVNALIAWLQAGGAAAQADVWAVASGVAAGLLPAGAGAGPPADGQRDAGLWGAMRVAQHEHADQRIRFVDLCDPEPCVANAALLAREILHPDGEDEIFLARGGRFVPRLRREALRRVAPLPADDQALRLGLPATGALSSLAWERVTLPAPGPREVEIDVRAAGLNFRDVMFAIGLLPEEALEAGFSGPTLGMELSGVITRVGADVADLAPGDEVLAFAPASFASRVVTSASAVAPKPAGWSFAAGASVPTAYFTAYYALHELARLREGERVLIHGAAGGVGLAAIQVARYLGAEVLATAGNPEKRDFVRLMGAQHAFDSRSLAFGDDVLRVTGGQGVDVILNSLAGEAINRNLRVLRPFGRLLELGKRDFYENSRIGLRPFRNNLAYFGIDADQLMAERPELARRVLLEMLALFGSGSLQPLPHRVFEAGEIATAFRTMRESRQIGKIVVSFGAGFDPPRPDAGPLALPRLRPDASYLVSGGLSGFGLRTAQWLAERGARHLVLLGRGGAASAQERPQAAAVLAQLARAGVAVAAPACDVSDAQALDAALAAAARQGLPPVRGVVHAAMVMDDALLRNITARQLSSVFEPKVLGARNLDRATRALELDFFVLYSSATTFFGNPGQAAYVGANMALEALARQRRTEGLPATCLCWGPIADVGYLAEHGAVRDALVARLGGPALPAAVALHRLDQALAADAVLPEGALGFVDLDWSALARVLPGAGAPKFAELARQSRSECKGPGSARDLRRRLEDLEPDELVAALAAVLCEEIGAVLRIAPERIEHGVSLFDVGMDSLMAMELAMALEARLEVKLPLMALSEGPTVARLAQRLVRELRPDLADEATESSADAQSRELETMVARHGGGLDAQARAELAAAVAADLRSGDVAGPSQGAEGMAEGAGDDTPA